MTGRPVLNVVTDDCTPIQLGTCGEWKGRKFELIGRLRCVFVENYTNNWTMLFDEGDIMMLVESFGQFAVYEKAALEIDVPFSTVAALEYGNETIELNENKRYILERESFCEHMETEGEAWLFDNYARFTCLEVAGQNGGRFALIGDKRRDDDRCFRIHYQQFSDFGFTNLRSQSLNSVTSTATCSNCKATVQLYSWPLAHSFTCTACGGCHVFEQDDWKFKRRLRSGKMPAIPLQSTGTIQNIEYRVVGYMEKEDEESYGWREYTLFNPVYGYAFLSEYNGHWIFLKEMADAPVLLSNKTTAYNYDGKTFKLFNQYKFTLVSAKGEFPGDAFSKKSPQCREFIAPPEIWVREMYEWGLCWFHGTHISQKELQAAFGNKATLPYKSGTGSVEPVVGQVDPATLIKSALVAVLVFVLLFLVTSMCNREQVVYDNTITLPDSTNIPMIVSPRFKLDKWRSNLEFDIAAPVSNNWFEAGITLVNADNGAEYTLEKGVEKYSGYEDGEHWTEGDDHDAVIMHSIPAGNYFLQIQPARGDYTVNSFSLKVIYDVPMWHNFWIFLMLAILPALGVYINMAAREGMRWQNSPFYHND
jgi:hypothetical protein